jgi:hypothetical protein
MLVRCQRESACDCQRRNRRQRRYDERRGGWIDGLGRHTGGSTDSGGTLVERWGGSTALAGTGGVPAELTVDNVGELVFETYCSFSKAANPNSGRRIRRERMCRANELGGDDFDHPVFWAKGTSLYQWTRRKPTHA